MSAIDLIGFSAIAVFALFVLIAGSSMLMMVLSERFDDPYGKLFLFCPNCYRNLFLPMWMRRLLKRIEPGFFVYENIFQSKYWAQLCLAHSGEKVNGEKINIDKVLLGMARFGSMQEFLNAFRTASRGIPNFNIKKFQKAFVGFCAQEADSYLFIYVVADGVPGFDVNSAWRQMMSEAPELVLATLDLFLSRSSAMSAECEQQIREQLSSGVVL